MPLGVPSMVKYRVPVTELIGRKVRVWRQGEDVIDGLIIHAERTNHESIPEPVYACHVVFPDDIESIESGGGHGCELLGYSMRKLELRDTPDINSDCCTLPRADRAIDAEG